MRFRETPLPASKISATYLLIMNSYDRIEKFQKMFPTERECREKLFQMRERISGTLCQRCAGDNDSISLQNGKKIRCKKCGGETAVTYGTIFYRSKLSLHGWFKLIWVWSHLPISATKLADKLELPFSTTFDCLQKLRKTFLSGEKLRGKLECDLLKRYSGGLAPYNAVALYKDLICVAVKARKNGAGQVRMMEIEDFSLEKYKDFKKKSIDPGTIEERGAVLLERTTERGLSTDNANRFSTLPSINKIAEELEAWLWDHFHGAAISSQYLQDYLDEFCFRWNNRYDKSGRENKEHLFQQALERAVHHTESTSDRGKRRQDSAGFI